MLRNYRDRWPFSFLGKVNFQLAVLGIPSKPLSESARKSDTRSYPEGARLLQAPEEPAV
jgi:hypothetical protein